MQNRNKSCLLGYFFILFPLFLILQFKNYLHSARCTDADCMWKILCPCSAPRLSKCDDQKFERCTDADCMWRII